MIQKLQLKFIVSGVKPTMIIRVGDPIVGAKLKSKTNKWKYKVDAKESFEVEVLVEKILRKFKDKRKLAQAISLGRAKIVCVVHITDSEPTIELSAKTIQVLAKINCGFWLDYYIRPESE